MRSLSTRYCKCGCASILKERKDKRIFNYIHGHHLKKGYWSGKKRTFSHKHIQNFKGRKVWNKDIKVNRDEYPTMGHFINHTNEAKLKMRLSHEGKSPSKKQLEAAVRLGAIYRGKNSPHWKGGITSLNKLERNRFRETMHKQILKRDNYKCVLCGSRQDLQVDHIQSWAEYIELRFNMDNCRTLCGSCHYSITFNKPMPKNIKTWGRNFSQRRDLL